MRRRTTRYGSWVGAGSLLVGLWLVLVLSDMASAETLSETSQDMAECAKIEDDAVGFWVRLGILRFGGLHKKVGPILLV